MKNILIIKLFLIVICAKSQNCNLPSIHFDIQSAKIKTEFEYDLQYVAEFLLINPYKKIVVTGWDTKDTNIAILRAEKSVEYLVDNCHFSCERFTTKIGILPNSDNGKKKYSRFPEYIFRRVDFDCN